MNVGDQWNFDLRTNLPDCRSVFFLGNRDANYFAARFFQSVNLIERSLHVKRVGRRHRLHPDRV